MGPAHPQGSGRDRVVSATIAGWAFIGWFAVVRLDRRRPARLRVATVRGRRAFTIPAAASTRYWALVGASGSAALAVANVISDWRVHHAYQVGAPVGAVLLIGLALLPGGLVIYPDRLTERAWRPKLSIAWSALAPPESPAAATIPLDELDVDPAFLTTVVQYYVEHPDQRADIGTPEGYQRLCVSRSSTAGACPG
jgi:hypothetical protein